MKIVYTSSVSSHGKFFFLFAMLTKALHQKIHIAYLGCLNGSHLCLSFLGPIQPKIQELHFFVPVRRIQQAAFQK